MHSDFFIVQACKIFGLLLFMLILYFNCNLVSFLFLPPKTYSYYSLPLCKFMTLFSIIFYFTYMHTYMGVYHIYMIPKLASYVHICYFSLYFLRLTICHQTGVFLHEEDLLFQSQLCSVVYNTLCMDEASWTFPHAISRKV